MTLEEVWQRLESSLRQHGLPYTVVKMGERWRLYKVEHELLKFNLAVAVNDLETPFLKHSIEDHLIHLATLKGEISEEDLRGHETAKEAWKTILKKKKGLHEEIYKEILGGERAAIHEAFKQHLEVIENLLRRETP